MINYQSAIVNYFIFIITYVSCAILLYPYRHPQSNIMNLKRVLYVNILNLFYALLFIIFFIGIIKMLPKIYIPYMLLQFLILIIGAELWFYVSHRLLHTKILYRYHKIHHQFNIPHSWVTLYCHPLEMIFSNIMTNIWTLIFMNYDYAVLLIWNIMIGINSTLGHSFAGPHRIHHQKLIHNFGIINLLDVIFKTKWSK